MKALVQRVRSAEVRVEARRVCGIDAGLLVYLGVETGDGESQAETLAARTAELRIFDDESGKMNLSVRQVEGAALVVSQFTLAADTRKGRRPSYGRAARPEIAVPLYERFIETLRSRGLTVQQGVFRATMQIESINDGPVTLMLDSQPATESP